LATLQKESGLLWIHLRPKIGLSERTWFWWLKVRKIIGPTCKKNWHRCLFPTLTSYLFS
jgi:hypothetical protein